MQMRKSFWILVCLMTTLGLSCARNTVPPHEELAILESGSKKPSSEMVEEFRLLLERLATKCPSQSREEIKENIIQGQKILGWVGKNLSLKRVAELMDETIPEGEIVEKCDKVNTGLIKPGDLR